MIICIIDTTLEGEIALSPYGLNITTTYPITFI